jgi:hypothetical protein
MLAVSSGVSVARSLKQYISSLDQAHQTNGDEVTEEKEDVAAASLLKLRVKLNTLVYGVPL